MNYDIAILLTTYNRRKKTINCLKSIYQQKIFNINNNLTIYCVVDGSTDDTFESIKKEFPDVKVIMGNGNLYWNQGMRLAWKNALSNKNHNVFLLLNDDTILTDNSLEMVINNKEFDILCGATFESQTIKNITYSGYDENEKMIKPNGSLTNCMFCNGNFLAINKNVYDKIGMLDDHFHHAYGDFDYTLRAKKAGFKLELLPNIIGYCESNKTIPEWRNPKTKIKKRFKSLYSPKSGCNPKELYYFEKKHFGKIKAIRRTITVHIRTLMPYFWCN